jgi:diaminohydroxyphosphoribosylaminopyrimidine deaminase/5-amino-6-(5-phosphoribosylamino)uracil reductase
VSAIEDPDPRVKGKGHAILRAAGIEVTTGIGAAESLRELAGFFMRIEKNRPYLILKLAISADGKIAARRGDRTRITGDMTRARVHLMRAQSDAILVGIDTVRVDDSLLLGLLPGLLGRSPVRLVADSTLAIPRETKLVQTAVDVATWILSTIPGEVGPGVEVIQCNATAGGRVDLADAMTRLASRGINRVMAEGGAVLARSLLEADLVDEVALFQAPMVVGEAGVDALAGLPLSIIGERFNLIARETLGSDALCVYGRR